MQTKAITDQSYIPMRLEPYSRSEMVSQLVFGEMYTILDEFGKDWYYVKSMDDGYEGWISIAAPSYVNDDFIEKFNDETPVYCASLIAQAGSEKRYVYTGFGSRLPLFSDYSFELPGESFSFRGEFVIGDGKLTDEKWISLAMSLLGLPYLWGGKSSFGLDCSGFIQLLFKLKKVNLPRDAWQQSELGAEVAFGHHKPGDVAFFSNAQQKITHVGLVLSDQKIIHASGSVRIDELNTKGIFNKELNKITHELAFIKRII